jgi:phosphoribosylanthranilate isomerase
MSSRAVSVKICGLKDATAARVAVTSGASALGFILAPSRRQVAPRHVRDIREELLSSFERVPPTVGVVVNASAQEIARNVSDGALDMIQLSGDEEPDILDDIDVPAIRMVRLGMGTPVDEARREVTRWLDRTRPAHWIFVEGHAAGTYGGTGTRADWDLVAALAREFPLWLAGGLEPGNVAEAINAVRPFGVDVSSGIETDGAKDPEKIGSFLANAQASSRSTL